MENVLAVGPYEVVLESNTIRILPREEALKFWKAWWEEEQKKK